MNLPDPKGTSIKFIHLDWLRSLVVAIIILLIVGGMAILTGRNEQKPVDWVNINAMSEKKQVDLPDGSHILLRKGSTLSYSANFGIQHRDVELKGEAFFEILYNSSVPFSVKAQHEITTETGTSFLVRSNDSVEQVIVSKGSVRFCTNTSNDEYVEVHAGQTAEIRDQEVKVIQTKGENYLSWNNEHLIFNQSSLKQVAEDIQNFYSVPVQIDPAVPANQIMVTGRFDNENLSLILKELGAKTGLMITEENKTVFVRMGKLVMASARTSPPEPPAAPPVKKNKKYWWMFWK